MKMLYYERFELRRIKEPLHRNKTKKTIRTHFLFTLFDIFQPLCITRMCEMKKQKISCFFSYCSFDRNRTHHIHRMIHIINVRINGQFVIELLFILIVHFRWIIFHLFADMGKRSNCQAFGISFFYFFKCCWSLVETKHSFLD